MKYKSIFSIQYLYYQINMITSNEIKTVALFPFKVWFKVCHFMFSAFLLWLYLAMEVSKTIYDFASTNIRIWTTYIFHQSPPIRAFRYLLGVFRSCLNLIKQKTEPIIEDSFMRRLRSEDRVATIFDRASARPDEITENEKVLLLMQKMRKLEETIFQESVDRRKAEQDLFDLKIQFSQKNATLIKERSESIENANKLNVLKLQLAEKNEQIGKSKQYISSLQQELKKLKRQVQTEIKQSDIEISRQNQQEGQVEQQNEEDVAEREEEVAQVEQQIKSDEIQQKIQTTVHQNKKKKKKN